MPTLLIRNVRLVEPGNAIRPGDVLVHDGRIVATRHTGLSVESATVVDGRGRLLTPGLIDVHTHGIMHSLYETGPDGLRATARELGRFGVTTVLPTIVPQVREGWLDLLGATAAATATVSEVNIPGLHIEGPFMTVGGAACPTLPGDLDLLERILFACNGRLAVMSVSPDAPNIVPVIRRLRQEKVTVFLTHTRAGVEQTEAAIEAGASHATHFYDVFYAPAESDPACSPGRRSRGHPGRPSRVRGFHRRRRSRPSHRHPRCAGRQGLAGNRPDHRLEHRRRLPAGVYDTPWGYRSGCPRRRCRAPLREGFPGRELRSRWTAAWPTSSAG
jgi:hypothetical protein